MRQFSVTLGSFATLSAIRTQSPIKSRASATSYQRCAVSQHHVQPDVSRLLKGHFRDISVERLLRLLTRLGCEVDIVIREQGGNLPAGIPSIWARMLQKLHSRLTNLLLCPFPN